MNSEASFSSAGLFAEVTTVTLAAMCLGWLVFALVVARVRSWPDHMPSFIDLFKAYAQGAWICAIASVLAAAGRLGVGGSMADGIAIVAAVSGPVLGVMVTVVALRRVPRPMTDD
jgi:hypothetical protein